MSLEKSEFQHDKIISISAGHLAHDTYSAFLGTMLPVLIDKLGFSLALAGFLDVIRRIPALFNPFIGLVADRTNLKLWVIITPAITTVCMSLLGLAPSYAMVAVLLFVAGTSASLFHVPSPVMIKQLAGDKVAVGMGYYMFGGELARTLGPLLITAALSQWGLEGSFRVMPLGLLASLLLYFKLKDVKVAGSTKGKKYIDRAGTTARKLLPFFAKISGFLFFRAGMKSALTVFLPTYLVAKGEPLWFAGLSLSVLQLAGAVGTLSAGYISERINRRNTLLLSAIFSPISMLVFIYIPKLMILALIIHGLFLFASGPVMLTLVQETDTDRPAFVNSLYMTVSFAISSIMVLVAGSLGDKIGLENTYAAFAWVSFLAIPCVLVLPSGKQNNQQKEKNEI